MSTLLMLLTLVLIVIAAQALAQPAAIRPGVLTMTLRAFAAAFAPSLAARHLPAPAGAKDQLHLYNWNNYIAPETIKRFEGAASARSCRPTTRTTRSCWPSSPPAPRATTCWCRRQRRAGADPRRAAAAARQGAAAEPEEHRPAYLEHAVRSGQQVLGAVRDVDDDHRLQRREDEGARPADRHVGGDLRSEVPGEGEGPRHGARQRERALRRRAQVSRLLGQRRRSRSTGTKPRR